MTMRNEKYPNQYRTFFALVRRHLLVFFKDVPTRIFTLMVPLAIFAVYAVFLRPREIDQIKDFLVNNVDGVTREVLESKQREPLLHRIYGIADCWMISGVLAVSCITVSLNSNYIVVRDKERKISRDFVSSPILPRTISFSYLVFNCIVTFMINVLVFFLSQIYLAAYGAYRISFLDFLAIIGIILLSSLSASTLTYFICSFIQREAVRSPIVAIVSAGVGFLIGAYRPSNRGPKYIGEVTRFFPGTYSAGLFRNYFMNRPVSLLTEQFSQAEYEVFKPLIGALTGEFSLTLSFFGRIVSPLTRRGVVFIFIGIFLVLDIIFSSRNALNFLQSRKKGKKKEKPSFKEGK